MNRTIEVNAPSRSCTPRGPGRSRAAPARYLPAHPRLCNRSKAAEATAAWKPVHHHDAEVAKTKLAKQKHSSRRHWKTKMWKRRTKVRQAKAEAFRLAGEG